MDYLILVAKKDLEIAKITIKSILTQDNEARIIVVTNECVLDNFIGPRITALDEDKFIKNLTLKTVRDIMTNLANQSERTGWYFQQFIKMAYSLIAERDYVVWESDTVMLKKIKFFEAGKNVLYFIDVMEHLPYLATMKRVLPNIQIIYNHSFICEKMFIDFKIMREIIHSIESRFAKPFFEAILENIELSSLPYSGFAEYATYANYALHYYPSNHYLDKARHFRSGTRIFGELPKIVDLQFVSTYYDSISFEKWQKEIHVNRNFRKILIDVLGFKIYSIVLFKLVGFINKIVSFKDRFLSS